MTIEFDGITDNQLAKMIKQSLPGDDGQTGQFESAIAKQGIETKAALAKEALNQLRSKGKWVDLGRVCIGTDEADLLKTHPNRRGAISGSVTYANNRRSTRHLRPY